MRRKAFVGVDGSANSENALLWAADWTDRNSAGLGVFLVRTHVSELEWSTSAAAHAGADNAQVDTEQNQRALTLLSEYVQDTIEQSSSRPITTDVISGDPAGSLLHECAESRPDLLVVGRRGRGGFARLLVGSVSDQCLGYAHCDTVVVPQGFHVEERNAVIVVGVDGSEDSQRALAWAVSEAPLYNAKIIVVSAWLLPMGIIASTTGALQMVAYGPDVFAKRAAEVAQVAVERALGDDQSKVQIETEVFESEPGNAIITIAKREQAQMIVVGHRGIGVGTALILGSVARNCVHHADCPVVIVRNPEAE